MIEGARVFSAFTREWLDGDVAIADGRIAGIGAYEGGERIDGRGRFLVPGFIDAHVHLESAKLTPGRVRARRRAARHDGGRLRPARDRQRRRRRGRRLAAGGHRRAAAGRVRDGAVVRSGLGLRVAARAARARTRCARSCEHPRALGVAEMMNFPGVIAGDPDVLARIVAPHVDGHAPGVMGRGAGRLRRRRDLDRPRGVHRRGGAGEAPARDVGADPRGLQRPQPARAAGDGARARAGLLRVLHRRPRAGLPLPRGPHRPDVPDRGRRGRGAPRTCS